MFPTGVSAKSLLQSSQCCESKSQPIVFTIHSQDSRIKIYWNHFTIDGLLRGFDDKAINQLVNKYDNQGEMMIVDYLSPKNTTPLLENGNAAIITLWEDAPQEILPNKLQSCDVHTFFDDRMQINHGYCSFPLQNIQG